MVWSRFLDLYSLHFYFILFGERWFEQNYKKTIFIYSIFLLYYIFFTSYYCCRNKKRYFIFFLSVAFFELSPFIKTIKHNKRKIFTITLVGFIVLSALTTLREIRGQDENIGFVSLFSYESSESQFSDQTLSATILLQDYFLPSHTLFISMESNIIDPLEVVKSNIANSLVLVKYPFLTTTILSRDLG